MWFIYNIIVAIKVFHKGEVEAFIQEIIKFVISDFKNEIKGNSSIGDGGDEYYNDQWIAMLLLWYCIKCHMPRLLQVKMKSVGALQIKLKEREFWKDLHPLGVLEHREWGVRLD